MYQARVNFIMHFKRACHILQNQSIPHPLIVIAATVCGGSVPPPFIYYPLFWFPAPLNSGSHGRGTRLHRRIPTDEEEAVHNGVQNAANSEDKSGPTEGEGRPHTTGKGWPHNVPGMVHIMICQHLMTIACAIIIIQRSVPLNCENGLAVKWFTYMYSLYRLSVDSFIR